MLRVSIFLVVLFAIAADAVAQGYREIRVTTADDVGIVGTYYNVPARRAPAVVLVHGWQQTRSEWAPLVALLQKAGIAALAIDLRGHGDSTRELTAAGPALVDPKEFTTRDLQKMQLDVSAAVDWLEANPDIDKSRIAVVGSSVGANIALRYAVANEDLAALVLLSPGINYRGIRTDDAMRKLRPLPLRLIVSRNDPFAIESAKLLIDIRKESVKLVDEKELIVCTGNLHGTEMLRGVNGLPELIADWLKTALAGAPAQAPKK
jgi:alpha-beta hydrolase superfamily lysophospholipase